MKILVITLLTYLTVNAQTKVPARINIYNASAGQVVPLFTPDNPEQPILIKARTWIILQPIGDSLGLLINEKPYFIHFEPGKQYYFMAQTNYGGHPTVTEKTEQEFLLTVDISRGKGPVNYPMNKPSN